MAVQTVFSDNLDPSNVNLSSRFKNGVGFYIDAPLIESELEIDVYLQVYFPSSSLERVRNIPLGTIKEQSILLNITDTETVMTIPNEYVDSDLEMALLFLPSSTTFLEAYVLGKNCTTCGLKFELDGVKNTLSSMQLQLDRIEAAVNNTTPVLNNAELFFFLQ